MLKSVWAGSTAVALLSAAVAWADEPAKAKEGPERAGRRVIVQAAEGQPGGTIKVIELREGDERERGVWLDAIKPGKVSDYWIGLECYPAEGALRTQLKLPEGQGLLIEGVVPDSPAAKAGLKQHDVLLRAGGKPVDSVADLVDAVDGAKDKKLSLEIIREGKPKKVDVTPAKRPKEFLFGDRIRRLPLPVPGNPDLEAFRKWHEQFKPGAQPPMRFRFFQPGMILPPGAPVHPPLPGNMTVAITRQGGQPARIVVQKDGQKWEVTEKELDKLPKDVRPHVERMLGRIPVGKPGDFDIDVDIVRPAPGLPRLPDFEPDPDKYFKRQLDQMKRELQELRKLIEQRQGNAKEPEQPKKR